MRIEPTRNLYIFAVSMLIQSCIVGTWSYGIWRDFAQQKEWLPLLQLLFIPLYLVLSSFFWHLFVCCISHIFCPRRFICRNSIYFSCEPEQCGPEFSFPDVTIQIPVYRESFDAVIVPTLKNVLIAAAAYKGKCVVFVNDDGLEALEPLEKERRIDFYRQNNIVWTGRPVNGRRGRFKKAGNMNYGLNSARGTDVIGKYIVLLDSDSRISPCILNTIMPEMERDPSLAYIQFHSEPMQAAGNYWEKMISHFTRNIYDVAFVLSGSGGDSSPLVGHNAVLRASLVCELTWSEDTVSEDFELFLRLHAKGYKGRYARFQNDFQEGVSLSVADELHRFQKYAWGVGELFRHRSFWSYIASPRIALHTRYNVLSYMTSYYALAFGPIMLVVDALARHYSVYWRTHMPSPLSILINCIIVFSILLPMTNIAVKLRLNPQKDVWPVFVYELKYGAPLGLFFAGLAYHVLVAITSQLFGLPMMWAGTRKEQHEQSGLRALQVLLCRFWTMWLIGCMVFVVICYITSQFQTLLFILIACHSLVPIVFNPELWRAGKGAKRRNAELLGNSANR